MTRQVFTMAGILAALASAKTGPTFYTPERVAIARDNIARYPWAQEVRRRIFETGDPISYYIGPTYTAADVFAAQTDEFIWQLQPPTTIPRVVFPHESVALCPVHGDAVRKVSVWCPWRIDPVGHPYQVQCPVGKEWYPSNAYHRGDVSSGPFPDDGSGCLYNGTRYFFLREYAHMVYGSVVIPTLRSLSQAYQLSGDPRYARQGCILLARLALEYPNYGWDAADAGLENRFARTYLGPWNNHHPHYTWKQGGMVTDLIWETFCIEAAAYAYDGLWDYMDRDPGMLQFLRQHGLEVNRGDDLRQYIETYIFRAGMRALEAGWIHGNEGFRQAAALAMALVLDDFSDRHPNSRDMVEYAYHGGGQAIDIMRNGVLPDGGGHESPNYSLIKLDFIRVARLMDELRQRHPGEFPLERFPDLFGDPKARALFDYYIDILVSDGSYPSIGDCGGLQAPRRRTAPVLSGLKHENVFAVQRYGDPRHARACLDEAGHLVTGELWEPFPEARIRELSAQPEAAVERVSRLLDAYGAAILESGDFARRRSVVLNYASILGHRQLDTLNLELYARQVYLLQDLGYPKTWEYTQAWDAHPLAHNTVTVDETVPPLRSGGGTARLFAALGGVHVAMASHGAYRGVALGRPEAPPVTVFERATVLVDVDEDRSYVVDLAMANGGEQHDQSWHAFMAEPAVPGLAWEAQAAGTLAGPAVPRFAAYTDRWGREHPKGDFASYLGTVRRARLAAPACWVWDTGLAEKDAVRLHVIPLGGPLQAIMGKGRSPAREELDILIVRRPAPDGSVSRFLTVIEPSQGEPQVRAVRVLSETPLVLSIELPDQRHEVTLQLPAGPEVSMATRPLGVGLAVYQGGAVRREVLIGACSGAAASGWAGGVVTQVEDGATHAPRITIRPDLPQDVQSLTVGRWVRLFSERRSAMYQVRAREAVAGGCLCLTLNQTLLLAEGAVAEASPTGLKLDARLLFARSLAGAALTASGFSSQLESAQQDGTLRLVSAANHGDLPAPGTAARLWQVAPGWRVEAPVCITRP